MGDLTNNFDLSEFTCKCGCGFSDISKTLVDKLQKVRDELCRGIIIYSGCRCEAYNKVVGGSQSSSHIKALAVDIKCVGSTYRFDLLRLLFKHFNRIGIRKDFIHVDVDMLKTPSVSWIYD